MYIGIDIGGTKCALTLGDDSGNIKEKISFKTTNVKESLENIIASVNKLGSCSAIGISCGGPLDSKNGIIMSPPNLPGWDNIPIVSLIEKEFGVPCGIQNDANACALAEYKYGAGRGYQNIIFLTFGTGLGAGLILNGKLYSGTNDMAGEVGHVRLEPYGPVGYGKAGSFEGFCSGGGIAQIGKYKAMEQLQLGKSVGYCANKDELDNITAKRIAEHAKNGDALSKEVFEVCAYHLGMGISSLIDILNPELVILGSIYGRCVDMLEPVLMDVLKKETLSYSLDCCKVVPAYLGENIGDYAALAVAATVFEERREKNA